MSPMELKTRVKFICLTRKFPNQIFHLVTLDALGEPVKKERKLETHCGWLCNKL